MLKGLKKLIFNTDVEDVSEEGIITEIELPKKDTSAYMDVPLSQLEKEETKEDKKPFTGINVDVEKPKEIRVKETKEREKVYSHKEAKNDTSAEYEFKPVLSPIFGNMSESEKNPKEVHDAVHLNKAKTKNPLNTVLSPMYGEYELESFEKEAKETIQKRKEKDRQLQVESSFQIEEQEEEETVFSLEEMLSNEEDDENEPVQISLFGDNTPIKDVVTKEEIVYQKKE